MKLRILSAFAASAALAVSSCASDPYVNAAQTRGAVGGAAIGAIIGNSAKGIGKGEAMIAGALIGGLMGENELRRNNPGRYYR